MAGLGRGLPDGVETNGDEELVSLFNAKLALGDPNPTPPPRESLSHEPGHTRPAWSRLSTGAASHHHHHFSAAEPKPVSNSRLSLILPSDTRSCILYTNISSNSV